VKNLNIPRPERVEGEGKLKEKLLCRTAADITEIELRKRKCRLIVRNLSFFATQQNVVDRVKQFGPLVSVDVPLTSIAKTTENPRQKRNNGEEGGGNTVVRPVGFAFVTYLCEKDAQAAAKNSGGLRVCNRWVVLSCCGVV
jgi:RNA recognition motif-containing protein